MSLIEQDVKDLALQYVQYEVNYDRATVAQERARLTKQQASTSWSEILRRLSDLRGIPGREPEDGDQERIISEARKMGKETPFLKKHIYLSFNLLGVTGKLKGKPAPPETPRTPIMEVAIEQALMGKKKRRIRTDKELELMAQVDTDLSEGNPESAKSRLETRLEEIANECGQLAWDYRDQTTLEKIFAYLTDDYGPRWHAQFDPLIEKERKQKAKKANGKK